MATSAAILWSLLASATALINCYTGKGAPLDKTYVGISFMQYITQTEEL